MFLTLFQIETSLFNVSKKLSLIPGVRQMKLSRGLFSILFLLACAPLFAQDDTDSKDRTNPLYEPVAVVQRLSYDNFKNIKLITVAVMNYGGGEAEFNRLVEGYADATALYFSHDYKKAADAFTKNEKDIQEVSLKLAAKYKQDSEALNREIIKRNVAARVMKSVKGEKPSDADFTAEKFISQAAESIAKANDAYVRVRPVPAISLYRRAKLQCIAYYDVLGVKEVNGQKLSDRFERDQADAKNKIYVSKEKKN